MNYKQTCPDCGEKHLELVHHDDTDTEHDPRNLADLLARPDGTNNWAFRFKVRCTECDYEINQTIA